MEIINIIVDNNKPGKGICWICGRTDHFKKNCPKATDKKNLQQKERVRNGHITNGDGGMYISGKILGQTVQCLVDTGANVTILSSKVYDSLPDKQKVTLLRPTHTNMKLADGKSVHVTGIGEMNIEIGKTSVSHDMWVASIDEDIDCTIGFDLMKQNNCCIDVANSTVTINNEKIYCAVVNTRVIRCCRIAVQETTVVPPGVEQIIPCKVLVLDTVYAPDCGMLLPTDTFVSKHQLLLANSTSETVPIRVLNVTDQSVKVYKKTCCNM